MESSRTQPWAPAPRSRNRRLGIPASRGEGLSRGHPVEHKVRDFDRHAVRQSCIDQEKVRPSGLDQRENLAPGDPQQTAQMSQLQRKPIAGSRKQPVSVQQCQRIRGRRTGKVLGPLFSFMAESFGVASEPPTCPTHPPRATLTVPQEKPTTPAKKRFTRRRQV